MEKEFVNKIIAVFLILTVIGIIYYYLKDKDRREKLSENKRLKEDILNDPIKTEKFFKGDDSEIVLGNKNYNIRSLG